MTSSGNHDDDSIHQYGAEAEDEVSDVPTPVLGATDNATDGTVNDVIRRLSSGSTSIRGQTHLFSPPPNYYDSGSQDSFSRSRSISDTLANRPLEVFHHKPQGELNNGGFEFQGEERGTFPVSPSSSKKNVHWGLNSKQLRDSIPSPPPNMYTSRDAIDQSRDTMKSSPSAPPVKLASTLQKSNRSSRVSFQDNIPLTAEKPYDEIPSKMGENPNRADDEVTDSNEAVYQQYEQRLSQIRNTLEKTYSQDIETPRVLQKFHNRLATIRAKIPQQYSDQHQYYLENENNDEMIFDGQDSDFTRSPSISYNKPSEVFRPMSMARSPPLPFSQSLPARSPRRQLSPRHSSQGFQTEAESLSKMTIPQLLAQLKTDIRDYSEESPQIIPQITPDKRQRSVAQPRHNFVSNPGSQLKTEIRDFPPQIMPPITPDRRQRSVAQSLRDFVSNPGSPLNPQANLQAQSTQRTLSPYGHSDTRGMQPQLSGHSDTRGMQSQLSVLTNTVRELENQISDLSIQHMGFQPSRQADVISNQGSPRYTHEDSHPLSHFPDHSFHGYLPHSEQEIVTRDGSRMASGQLNTANSIHSSQNNLNSVDSSQNPVNSTQHSLNNLNSIHPSQNNQSSIHPSHNNLNSIHPSQNNLNSIHPSQNNLNSIHPSQNNLKSTSCEQSLPNCRKEQMVCCRQVYHPQRYLAFISVMVFLICLILVCSVCYDVNTLSQNKTRQKFNSITVNENHEKNAKKTYEKNAKKTCPFKEIKSKLTEEIHSDTLTRYKKTCNSKRWFAWTLNECSENG